ncbi:anti-sigma-28 factor, FlgM family [Caminicella sporogenes DSM 14501]|uniref:Negative regulator of flagellin synthesis n=1 Tax=Caminicella sporogenes DSM 14501 TaxID=1121266 RepID=A0A1M6Q158_9FIRM|nr:flagellar biosynthesis anti-sigma factor FlgM [Caminicella sporogenes]RKD23539.1 flagellar biosynthesis anti-sigma factor FlgM [Caminicella sporogenes]SHK13969.1 anti-sigma-28 factor, FlgM family [Caminicella sporogenes DSM 14501]
MKIFSNINVQKVMGAYKSKMNKTEKVNKSAMRKDKVEISEKAKDFQIAMNAFNNLSGIRSEKVEDIKKAIALGTYNPKAKEVVDKMFERVNFDRKV